MTKKRIMIVEDEVIVASDLRMRLREMGYNVCAQATSGEEALRKAGEVLPDLILMDVYLSGEMDGIEAARRIGLEYGLPVLFLTAYADRTLVSRAKMVEPFGLVLKPFVPYELRANIEMALYKSEMERRLKESEERYRLLAEYSADVVMVFSLPDFRLTYVSPAGEGLFGRPAEEMVGLTPADLMTAEASAHLEKVTGDEIERARKGEDKRRSSRRMELEAFNGRGVKFWLELTISLLPDDSGRVSGIIGTGRDVTVGKLTSQALQESQSRYLALFRESPISLWEEDFSRLKLFFEDLRRQGVEDIVAHLEENPDLVKHCAGLIRVVDINPATLDLFEASNKSELLGALDKVIVAESRNEFITELSLLWNGALALEQELVNRTLSGRKLFVSIKLVVAKGYEDTWKKVFVSLVDFTKRRQVEEAWLENQARLLDLAAKIPGVVFQARVETTGVFSVPFVSERCREFLGPPPDRIQTEPGLCWGLVDERDRVDLAEAVKRTIESRADFSGEFRVVRPDGRTGWLEVKASGHQVSGGFVWNGVAMDVSARKSIEAEREELISELRDSLAKVKRLSGLLPICASCKKVRDDDGYWNQVEVFVRNHSEAEFSHSICPDCARRLYPQFYGEGGKYKLPGD